MRRLIEQGHRRDGNVRVRSQVGATGTRQQACDEVPPFRRASQQLAGGGRPLGGRLHATDAAAQVADERREVLGRARAQLGPGPGRDGVSPVDQTGRIAVGCELRGAAEQLLELHSTTSEISRLRVGRAEDAGDAAGLLVDVVERQPLE